MHLVSGSPVYVHIAIPPERVSHPSVVSLCPWSIKDGVRAVHQAAGLLCDASVPRVQQLPSFRTAPLSARTSSPWNTNLKRKSQASPVGTSKAFRAPPLTAPYRPPLGSSLSTYSVAAGTSRVTQGRVFFAWERRTEALRIVALVPLRLQKNAGSSGTCLKGSLSSPPPRQATLTGLRKERILAGLSASFSDQRPPT